MLAGHDYGFKNDIWAIGILHYEMLTGVHPFIFDSHFTCEKAVQFIKQNLPHIYEPQYIKKNL
jgi:serine/threonine protein kinase